ncbi:MAG: hypothetical protein COA78_07480 [Blastopirellula sp.]|nr:MAG: hypothetical protein COA78_07480 [Blastopirellula sp.]
MRLTLKILLLTLTTLPAVGCFGIRYRDPSLSSYEEFTDTTVTLSISGDSCSSTSNSALVSNEYTQSGEDSSRQQSTVRAPLPRFLPAPTQPVFNTRAEYEPPQAMLKVIPVKVSQENNLFGSGFIKHKTKLQSILESDVNINPIENQPGRLSLPQNTLKPLKEPEENKPNTSEPDETILKVRIVQGTWQPKSK